MYFISVYFIIDTRRLERLSTLVVYIL